MRPLSLALLCGAVCLAGGSVAFGQQAPPPGYTIVLPATKMAPPDSAAEQLSIISPVVSPLVPDSSFTFTVTADTALNGGTYTGTILGRSPLNRGKTTTTIPTQVIPLVITINDGTTTVVYDATAPDSCVPGNLSTVQVVNGSPVFNNVPWTMNGVAIGNTQYIDAFQRAQFWSLVQGTPYHLILNQSVPTSESLAFGPGAGTNYPATEFGGTCGNVGVVNTNNLDTLLQGLITGPLASIVNAGTFPIFLTKNVVSSQTGITIFSGCCVLGYHSGLFVGGNLQIYGIFSIDSTGVFPAGYVTTLSHEVAEAVNDPTGNNPTPVWGNIGQTSPPAFSCQGNLEVGDPLSPGFSTPSNPFSKVGSNGLTYDVQELTYYSWFFGATPLGVGAGPVPSYSNNGTFHHTAVVCPPGTPTGGPY
jgi:hypothetical protein